MLRDPLTATFATNEITHLLSSKPKEDDASKKNKKEEEGADASVITEKEPSDDEKRIEALCKRYLAFIGSFTGNEEEENFEVLVAFLRGIGEVCLTAPWHKELFSKMGLFPVLMTLLTLQTPRHPERKASIVDECLSIIYYYDEAVFEAEIGYDQLKVVLLSFIDYLDQPSIVDRLFENALKTKRKENWGSLVVRYPKFLHIACGLLPRMHDEVAINRVLERLKGLLSFLPNVAVCCDEGTFGSVLDTIESLYQENKEDDKDDKKDIKKDGDDIKDKDENKDEDNDKDEKIDEGDKDEKDKNNDNNEDKDENDTKDEKDENNDIDENNNNDEKKDIIKHHNIDVGFIVSNLADIAQTLGSYSIRAKELSHLFRLMSLTVTSPEHAERGYRHSHFPYLVRCLHGISSVNAGGPSAYFVFNGMTSRIILPKLDKWPFQKGFTFCAWVRIETAEAGAKKDSSGRRHLCYFADDGGDGQENAYDIFISANDQLNIETTHTGTSVTYSCSPSSQLPRGKWFFLAMSIAPSPVVPMSGEVKTFINGAQISKVSIRYPKLETAEFGAIGCKTPTAAASSLSSGFYGQIGSIHLFEDALSSTQIEDIYLNGANYTGSFTSLE